MFDHQSPEPIPRSRRIAAELGGLIVVLVLAMLMALFAMAAPEPPDPIHGSLVSSGVVAAYEQFSPTCANDR